MFIPNGVLICDICGRIYEINEHKKYKVDNRQFNDIKSITIGYNVESCELHQNLYLVDNHICPKCTETILDSVKERSTQPGTGVYDHFVRGDKYPNGIGIICCEGCSDEDDIYYWDQRVIFTYKDRLFIHVNFGSGSGYNPNYGGIAYLSDDLINIGLLKNWNGNIDYDVSQFNENDLANYANALIASGLTYLDLWRDEDVDDKDVLRP